MKITVPDSNHRHDAFTLIEVTLVIGLILGLSSVLFVGITAYKKGSDRAICIQQLASVQKALRSFANLYALGPGETYTDLKDQIVGPGKFITTEPACPGNGTYTYGGDAIPAAGTPYLSCSIGSHIPVDASSW